MDRIRSNDWPCMATRFIGRDAVHREFPASPFAGMTKFGGFERSPIAKSDIWRGVPAIYAPNGKLDADFGIGG